MQAIWPKLLAAPYSGLACKPRVPVARTQQQWAIRTMRSVARPPATLLLLKTARVPSEACDLRVGESYGDTTPTSSTSAATAGGTPNAQTTQGSSEQCELEAKAKKQEAHQARQSGGDALR